jgi:hypothetical protein
VQALRIIVACILGAVVFGVVHDQVTARICVEYFTLGHPKIVESQDPTVLGIVWGVVASWWVGALLGLALALAARKGPLPRIESSDLIGSVVRLLLVMTVCSTLAGVLGWQLARHGVVVLVGPLHDSVPESRHVPFIAVLWAHSASYLIGFGGGILLTWKTWLRRKQSAFRNELEARVRQPIR